MSSQEDGTFDRRKFLKASGAGAVAVSLAGCQGGGDGTPTETTMPETETTMETETTEQTTETVTQEESIPRGGTFTYGMTSKPDSPNPLLSGSVYSAVAVFNPGPYDGPIASDAQFNPQPWIYTDWEIRTGSDAPSDKPQTYFNVRDDVKWGNGDDFTIEDVLFTYDYIVGNNATEYSSVIDNLAKKDAVPKSEVQSRLGAGAPDEVTLPMVSESDEANWDMTARLSGKVVAWQFNSIGAIDFLPKSVWEGQDYKNFNPVAEDAAYGTGPGQLVQFNKDTSMRVEINNDYYINTLNQQDWVKNSKVQLAGGPFVDAFNFKIFGSESAMTQAFLQGEIDAHYGSIQPAKRDEVRNTEGKQLVSGPDSGFGYFGFNLQRTPLDDVAFRQAVNFMFDNVFWVRTLNQNNVIDGDYTQSPGYPKARPETYFDDAQMLEHPATDLFDFRAKSEGSPAPDVEGVRNFLKNGTVVTGGQQTVVGQDFPGTLFDDISAAQDSSTYNYTFGKAKSQILKDNNISQEIRVDGQTIPEIKEDGNIIRIITDPPTKAPRQIKAMRTWVSNLRQVGIPAELRILSFNTLVSETFNKHNFDITELGWAGTSPYGNSNYFFFHKNFWTEKTKDFDYNYTAYGVGDNDGYNEALNDAHSTLDVNEASKKFARTMERIYLDVPYRVFNYSKVQWPFNSADWAGAVSGQVDPPFASWGTQANNIHKRQ